MDKTKVYVSNGYFVVESNIESVEKYNNRMTIILGGGVAVPLTETIWTQEAVDIVNSMKKNEDEAKGNLGLTIKKNIPEFRWSGNSTKSVISLEDIEKVTLTKDSDVSSITPEIIVESIEPSEEFKRFLNDPDY